MSPSENDLRAALRDGEGDDRPDVDGLLAHVRGRRAQRRTRVLSAAAAVVIVAGAAVGGAALWGGSDGGGPQAGGTRSPSPAIASRTPDVPFSPGVTESAPCPTVYPGHALGASDATTTGPMFSAPVASITVCAYGGTGASAIVPTSAPLGITGTQATELADSIEAASKVKLKIMCPDIVTADKMQLAIIGVSSDGTQLPVVTTDVSVPNCNQPITNGTAVRYAWKPPADLAGRIAALSTRGSTGDTAPGTVAGPSSNSTSGSTTGLPSMSTTSGKIGTPVR